jgi:hypothetical protein
MILQVNNKFKLDKNTFNNVKKWYDEVREIKGKDVFILVVANKIDIP